jgi:hypothetical protein
MNTRMALSSRQTWLMRVTMLTALLVLPALAHAHGGMGPDEVGPPIGTASLLGFVSYWVVMLWPSARKRAGAQVGPNGQNTSETEVRPRRKRNPRVKRIAHLRKVETGRQFSSDEPARRKASDG